MHTSMADFSKGIRVLSTISVYTHTCVCVCACACVCVRACACACARAPMPAATSSASSSRASSCHSRTCRGGMAGKRGLESPRRTCRTCRTCGALHIRRTDTRQPSPLPPPSSLRVLTCSSVRASCCVGPCSGTLLPRERRCARRAGKLSGVCRRERGREDVPGVYCAEWGESEESFPARLS